MTHATRTDEPEPRPDERAWLVARLGRLRRSIRLQLGLETLLDGAAGLVVAGVLLVGLDAALRPGRTAREAMLGLAIAVVGAATAIRAVPRLRTATLDDLGLATALDRIRPGTGGQVADVLQLPATLDDPRSSTSPAFVRLAVRRAIEALDTADWGAAWNRRRTAARAAGLLGLALVPIGFAAVAPESARLSLARWFRGSSERWPQSVYLAVAGLGDGASLLAPRNEPLAVEVRADLPGLRSRPGGWALPGRGGVPLPIRRRPDPPAIPATVRLRERSADGNARDVLMTAVAPGRFRHELPPSSASSTFELVGGDDWLGPIRVERVARPSIGVPGLRVREPGSPGAEFRAVADASHPAFLADTEIELTLAANEPIARARVEVHPGAAPEVTRGDPSTFVARWTLREATTLELGVTSARTGLDSKPAYLSIGLVKDREPKVTLRVQGVGAHVTPTATIPVALGATDDLGLAALRLRVEQTTVAEGKAEPTTNARTVAIPLDPEPGRAVLDRQARHDVDLQAARPPIGALIRLQAEAEDRCARGPQVSRSGAVQLQVVSPDELFYEILIRQRAERARFVAILDAAETQTPALAGARTSEAYTNASRSLHTGARGLDGIAGRIADSLVEMKLNGVGSPKSHRLLQDGVIDPIRVLIAGPISELRAALQAPNVASNEAASAKARRLQAEVVARLRTILDQMSQWESFVDVVNQVAEVIKMQRKVLEATETARESRTQEVFDDPRP